MRMEAPTEILIGLGDVPTQAAEAPAIIEDK
jgi:hypothetical protein